MISSLEENKSSRYTKYVPSTLLGGTNFYVTIFRVTSPTILAKTIKYILMTSPIMDYSLITSNYINFLGIHVNPYTTEITFSRLYNASSISYSISKSLVYLFYDQLSFPLFFNIPFVSNPALMKQAILNIFGFPTFVFMLYESMFIQVTYVDGAYQAILTGKYDDSKKTMTMDNFFDFNRTLVVMDAGKPYVYWNINTFSTTNQLPYVSFATEGYGSTSLIIGFMNNYILQVTPTQVPDRIALATDNSVNTNETPTLGVGYVSLAEIVPLTVSMISGQLQGNNSYYLNGVSGIGFADPLDSNKSWAVLQVANLFNSNNAYVTESAILVKTTSKTGLTQYLSTTFFYSYDEVLNKLTVWEDPTQDSFEAFLLANHGTIMTSDLRQMTHFDYENSIKSSSSSGRDETTLLGSSVVGINCSGMLNNSQFTKKILNVETEQRTVRLTAALIRPNKNSIGMKCQQFNVGQMSGYDAMMFMLESGTGSFTMKNITVDLDIIFLDSTKRVSKIFKNLTPCETSPCTSYTSSGKYAIQVAGGTCDRQNIKVGDKVRFN